MKFYNIKREVVSFFDGNPVCKGFDFTTAYIIMLAHLCLCSTLNLINKALG